MTRPFVVTSSTVTIDGRVADFGMGLPVGPDRSGEAMAAAEGADVLLTGADTQWPLAWRPGSPAAVSTADLVIGTPSVPARQGSCWIVVTDSRARLPMEYFDVMLSDDGRPAWPGGPRRERRRADLVILASSSTPLAYLGFLESRGVPFIRVGSERVDLARALEVLSADFGATRVLADGGSQLHNALLRAELIDEIDLYYLPAVAAQPGRTLFQVEGESSPPVLLDLVGARADEHGGVRVRFRVRSNGRRSG